MITALERVNEGTYFIKFVGIGPRKNLRYGIAEILMNDEDVFLIATNTDRITKETKLSDRI